MTVKSRLLDQVRGKIQLKKIITFVLNALMQLDQRYILFHTSGIPGK